MAVRLCLGRSKLPRFSGTISVQLTSIRSHTRSATWPESDAGCCIEPRFHAAEIDGHTAANMVKWYLMEIIHVDDNLIVINKPAGLSVLADGWEAESVHVTRLLEADFGHVWVVHRLDKGTSGVLVLARTESAHRALSIQFERHEVVKIYHAIVCGSPPWEDRTTHNPLRLNVGHKHRTAIDQSKGKPATTTFRVLERLREHTLLEVRPLTGRTHQVRAHAAWLHIPLLGDVLYGAPLTELIARPALHALSLTFTSPQSGAPVTFTAPYPADFEEALRSLRVATKRQKKQRTA